MNRGLSFAVLTAFAIQAAAAGTVSGVVTDERGAPVAGVDLDFVVVATGQPRSANGDVTDATGHYATTMPNDVYHVTYTPPPGVRLAGHLESDVNLNVNQTRDVVLRDAWIVSGTVGRSDTAGPAAFVDLDFVDLSTGAKLFTPGDDTDAAGAYAVLVPVGIYDVFFDGPDPEFPQDPPKLASAVVAEFSVSGTSDPTIAPIVLAPGFHVSGEVLDDKGDGAVNADLDFLDPTTGTKLFSKTDNTDARGRFDTVMPAGTYDVQINPPAGAALAARIVPGVVVASDTSMGTVTLDEGFPVAGVVRDPDFRPRRDVDLDFRVAAGGPPIPTAWDETAADGTYRVYVPTGSYDIRYRPLVDSHVEETVRTGVAVVLGANLPDEILPHRDGDGDGVSDVDDVCAFVADPGQADADADGVGDACDRCPTSPDPRQEDNDRDGAGDACDADDDDDGVADTVDPDLDGDGIPNASDNCPSASNADQADRDGDLDGDACDPDDGEVEWMAAAGDGFELRPETGAASYAVHRQTLARLSRVNYGAAVQYGLVAPRFRDRSVPPPGSGWIYLATAKVAGVEGSLGRRSDGGDRPNLRPCP